VPAALARLTLTCPFNDADAVRDTLQRHEGAVAAIIVEPFLGNVGFVPPAPGFLAALRALADESGALLIFDEVITGFRVGPGGAQGLTGVTPDLTTLGKIIGGGFPVGAYGGRRSLMEMVAPRGSVYQAGTLAGNPVAMSAGAAALRAAGAPGFYQALERRTRALVDGLRAAAAVQDVPLTAAHAGSLWGFFFHPGPVTDYASAKGCDVARFARFHAAARERGVLLAPSAFEAAFVSAAHTDDIIADTVERLADALAASARS
jgi:glutamate-1-semialdehyde 2,1-aminomutase